MSSKTPFPITGDHLLTILNDPRFKRKLERCNWAISRKERGFCVDQAFYDQEYRISPVYEGTEDTVQVHGKNHSNWINYGLLTLHSHDEEIIIPSIVEDAKGEEATGDLYTLWDNIDFQEEQLGIRSNNLEAVMGRLNKRFIPLLIIQQVTDRVELENLRRYNDFFSNLYFNSTEEVASALQASGLWRALYLELPTHGFLKQDFAKPLDKFSLIPVMTRSIS